MVIKRIKTAKVPFDPSPPGFPRRRQTICSASWQKNEKKPALSAPPKLSKHLTALQKTKRDTSHDIVGFRGFSRHEILRRNTSLHRQPSEFDGTALTSTTKNNILTLPKTNIGVRKEHIRQKNPPFAPFGHQESDTVPSARNWTIGDVSQYFECFFPKPAKIFVELEIDGCALLLIKRRDLLNMAKHATVHQKTELDVGTALKMYSHVLRLQTLDNDIRLGWNRDDTLK